MISLLIQCVVRLSLLAGEIIKAYVELPEWPRGDQKQGTSELVCLGDKMNSLQQGIRGVSLFSHIGVTPELGQVSGTDPEGCICACENVCICFTTLKYEEHKRGESMFTHTLILSRDESSSPEANPQKLKDFPVSLSYTYFPLCIFSFSAKSKSQVQNPFTNSDCIQF